MNKIYKVIWSKTRNCYVAVSEIAKRNGKNCTSVNCGGKANRRCVALSLALALCVTGGAVFTTPQVARAADITITSGSVTISDDKHAADDYYLNGSNITFTVNAGGVVNSISGNSDAAVSGNTVTINGGTVNHADTDWTESPAGSGNLIGKPNLAGGVSTSGAVTGNQVSITNATLIGYYPTVYGGYSQTGNASKNSVTFESGNNQELYINGGFSATGVAGGDTAADGNIVTIKSGTVNFVAGGYSERGSAKNNQVSVSGGTVNAEVYGGYVGGGTGEATNNKVEISGGTVGSSVYGGYSYTGTAEGNNVNVTGGHIAGAVYGGKIYGDSTNNTGAVIKNIVSVSGSGTQIDGEIQGGNSTYGKVDGNKVIISNGKLSNVVGGASSSDVVNNEVTITGGNMNNIYGGYIGSGTGKAEGNKVYISQSSTDDLTTINGFVYGGNSYNGNASLNEVTFTGGSVAKGIYGGHIGNNNSNGVVSGNKVTLDGSSAVVKEESYSNGVCGGYNWGSGAATGNQVEIKNGATVNNTVYGGYTYSGVAGGTTEDEGNKVIISSGTVTKGVYGGYAYGSGSATGNKVDISQTGTAVLTTISGSVYGGYSANGNAGGTGEGEGNKVTISDGKVTQSVYGGYVNGGTGTAGYNSVEITGGNLNNTYGGYINSGTGKAEGNKVSISGTETTTSISGTVYGGRASGGNATDNKVDISGGTVGSSVYGGYSYTGTAEGNTVNVTGGHMKSIYGAETSGDSTGNNGAVIKNIVSVSGSGTQIDGTIYGGSSIWGKVDGNKVTISNGTLNYVMGGRSSNGDVVNNEVTVTGGTLSDVHGGFSQGTTENSKAEGNKVIISGPETTVNNVYGGRANRNALNNSVTISGGTVNYGIYGGNASDGSASNNTVTITGNATIKSSILGGLVTSQSSGDASGNTVTISGSPNFMFEGSSGIWGGRAMGSGAAKNNTVNILSSIDIGFLIGGQSINNPSNVSGNTLNIAVKNVTVGKDNIRGFQNMNFYLPANIAKDDTMLTVNGGSSTDVKGVTFGVAALNGVKLVKGDTVNLLVNSNGLTTD